MTQPNHPLNFKDVDGAKIESGDLILRDNNFIELVEFMKGAYTVWTIGYASEQGGSDYFNYYFEHIGLFYDNWSEFKKQGIQIIAKDVL